MPDPHGAARSFTDISKAAGTRSRDGAIVIIRGCRLTLLSIVSVVVVWVAHPVRFDVVEMHVKRYRQQFDPVQG